MRARRWRRFLSLSIRPVLGVAVRPGARLIPWILLLILPGIFSAIVHPGNKATHDPEKAAYWLPVDLYIGGVEHAILHFDLFPVFHQISPGSGSDQIDEPFPHYLAQGMVTKDGSAMSKSRGNVVDPDGMIKPMGLMHFVYLFSLPLRRKRSPRLPGRGRAGRLLSLHP